MLHFSLCGARFLSGAFSVRAKNGPFSAPTFLWKSGAEQMSTDCRWTFFWRPLFAERRPPNGTRHGEAIGSISESSPAETPEQSRHVKKHFCVVSQLGNVYSVRVCVSLMGLPICCIRSVLAFSGGDSIAVTMRFIISGRAV